MLFTLRPYQSAALDASYDAFIEGVRRQLIQLPTGMGKTPTFASVPKRFNFDGRILVMVHREELADQAADKMKKWNPGVSVGIEMGARQAEAGDQIVVASVQTMGAAISRQTKRLGKYDPSEFDAVIIDEAHHYVAPTYIKTLDYFGLHDDNSKTLFLGVTATPNRGDGAALATVFDRIVYKYTIRDGIQEGWLADLRGLKVKTRVNLDGVKTVAGDFNQNELSDAVNTPARNAAIVQAWIENAHPRQTIAFCVDIQHAKDFAAAFQQKGVPAEAVWGNDPDRAAKLARHRAGELKVLTNVNVLTEGYDDWRVGCVIMARPTKSQLLFVQMAGRGTRIPEGINNLNQARLLKQLIEKEDCLLMDVVDTTSRHSLVTLASIFGMNAEMDLRGKSVIKSIQRIEELEVQHPNADFQKVTDIDNLQAFVESVNLFEIKVPELVLQHSELRWHLNYDGSYSLLLPKNERISVRQNMLGQWEMNGTIQGQAHAQGGFTDFPDAVGFTELLLSTFGREYINMLRREWKSGDAKVTDNQLGLLRKLFARKPAELAQIEAAALSGELTKSKASNLISNTINQRTQTRGAK